MESSSVPYAHLLEKTRLPQPSFQRYAVISIFEKLRSAPSHHGLTSNPGRDALSRCLTSPSAAVADQAVRETCRLVAGGHLPPSPALLELQSALEGCDPSFVPLFVKGIGFLSRLAFRAEPSWGRRFSAPELHPFVKVLSSRSEVHAELIQQVLLFIWHNKSVGIEAVMEFLRPFLMFSVIRKPFSLSSSCFARDLISSVASLSCSFPRDAICIIRLLTRCFKYFPNKNEEEFKYLISSVEYLVDAFVVVLKQIAGVEELQSAAQSCSLELLEILQSLCSNLHKPLGGIEIVLELSKRLLVAQKLLGFPYLPEFVMVTISISLILTKVEFEHEHLLILKILIFLLEWKTEKESCTKSDLNEELLLVFPVINLFSSPSRPVKEKAAYLLSASEGLLLGLSVGSRKAHISGSGFPSISKPESILFRLICHLWFQEQSSFPSIYYLDFFCSDISSAKEEFVKQKYWTSQVREYLLTIGIHKVKLHSPCPEDMLPGMSLLLSSVTSILAMHPTVGKSAVDLLVVISRTDPNLGMPMLLFVLFYTKMLCSHQIDSPDILVRLLELLPSVALHSDMVPLVIQAILPMLHKGAKPVLYAAAVRLLCKTWIVTDRAFGTLQGILDPKAVSDFTLEREICLSIAASVRDVCKHNPDRGVDLILSVSSCIESQNSSIQALGLESLAHLCEADVVDFYTAWKVIGKHILDYSSDPVIAHSLCTLLKWGAMDAEAYHDGSKNVLHILWEVALSRNSESLWVKARVSAFNSLSHYEIVHVQETIADFRKGNMLCLTSEGNSEVLKAMEKFEVKIINFDHETRRRVHKQKRVMVHKVDKLLDIFPQVMFSPGKQNFRVSDLPGAALLSPNFVPKDFQSKGKKDMPQVHAVYENTLMEIAESLHIPRNIFIAILALQSWKSFIERWLNAKIISSDTKVSSNMSDRSSKVAFDIFKSICKVAQDSIPRVAVNIALAVGALCLVLPPSAHAVISAAVDFLLNWLFEYEHEYKQWSAAISLGLVSNCFHATDRNQKFRVVNALLKVLRGSKSHLVKGACGSGLGFACQDLLTMVEVDEYSIEGRTKRLSESMLLKQIVRTLSLTLCKLCPFVSESLRILIEWFSLDEDNMYEEIASNWHHDNIDNLEEDAWGVAGLVLGLGNSVVAVYRFGSYDAVLKIKDILISWIAHGSSVHGSFALNEMTEISLSMGSCLVLPTVVDFCQRVELMHNDLDVLLESYVSLISELLNLKKSGILHQNFLMASCIGAGSFLSCVLSDGVHPMRFDDVKHFLEILRSAYTHPYPPIVHLGGLLGVINAFGAGAGDLTHTNPLSTSLLVHEQESSFVRGSILSTPICESLATTIVQEIFLLAKDSMDQHIRSFAAWAVSFLRQGWWSKEHVNANGSQMSLIDPNSPSQNFAEESLVWKLCLWLRDINYDKTADIMHAATVSTVLRCLSEAPRLPGMDWGPIIRRFMRYERQLSVKTCMQLAPLLLREECIRLCLAHARNVNAFLLFLDELTEQSRFRTLELNLQSTLLLHLSDLVKTFSSLRVEKLLAEFFEYFNSLSSPFMIYDVDQKILLRVSFWKGLHQCLIEASKDSVSISKIEKCMEWLFYLLPALTCYDSSEGGHANSIEWSEAIRCLCKARQDFLIHFLQVPDISTFHGGSHYDEVAKLITARARLVRNGCFPISELGKIKAYILNARYHDTWWSVLVEVVAAVSTAGVSVKRQWLLDGLEISCIAEYPSTVLRFIGLLSGSCCKYMPLLIIDPNVVLSDLPVTLPSLLLEASWSTAAETLLDKLWASTERICSWAAQLANGNGSPYQNVIDGTEASMSAFLARMMHQTCVSLKDHLPYEKQLRLANMEFL